MINISDLFEDDLRELEKGHLMRRLVEIEPSQGPRVIINGKVFLLLCSNDYLGLAGHPAIRAAAQAAVSRYGVGSGSSRLISGTSPLHRSLEDRIAAFKQTEAALVFNSGYAANTGVIPAIAGSGDVIMSDSLNHASIIDGCRLSRADVFIYRHGDMNHLETLLKDKMSARRRVIVTDGVFSMDGDIAPLPDIVSLAEKYNGIVMVDDAHATGILGENGRGTAEYFGIDQPVHIQMGTFGKALGTFGAYIAGSRKLIDYLLNHSRSFLYSTSLPPSICAATHAAIDIINTTPDLRRKLIRNRMRFAAGLAAAGISRSDHPTPIVPVIIGTTERTLRVAGRLLDLGMYAAAIRPPTVAEGSARIRITVMASHSENDVDTAVQAFVQCAHEGLIECNRIRNNASSS